MGGIIPGFGASGNSGNYFQVRSKTTGQVFNGATMESWNQAHWATYVLAGPEDAGSGCYVLTIPGGLPDDFYNAVLYTPLGGSPASGDTPIYDEDFNVENGNIISVGSGLNIGQINGSAAAAVALGVSAKTFVIGAAAAGTLGTSQMTTNLTGTVANMYAGRTLLFTSGANAGIAVLVTGYAVTGGKLTFIAYNNQTLATPPSAADTFVIF